MNTLKRTLLSVCIISLGLTSGQLFAGASATSKYVKDVRVALVGMAATVTVTNTSAAKHVNSVKLGVAENAMKFDLAGTVICNPGIHVKKFGAYASFGNVTLSGGNLNTTATAHTDPISVGFSEKNKDVIEYTPVTFTVPLSKVKNATPSLRVDPIAELNKKLQQYIQSGGKAVDFYRNDQTVVLQRPITVSGICGNNSKRSGGYETKQHVVQINYVGDSKVYEAKLNSNLVGHTPNTIKPKPVPKLNPVLVGNLPGDVNTKLPFKLESVEFQSNIPHYAGKCLPIKNPKIRMNFKVSGSEIGLIDLRVKSVSNTYVSYGNYFKTSNMVRNPKHGASHLDFQFPLKEMLAQHKYSYMAGASNKSYNHNMLIEARYKNMNNGEWSDYKTFGGAVFKHRCQASLNPQLGSGNNGMKGYQEKPGIQIKKLPVMAPKPVRQNSRKLARPARAAN